MIGLMSLWTAPFLAKHGTYSEDYLMLWAYSVALARKIFPKLMLFTDTAGFQLLKNFPYDDVDLSLTRQFIHGDLSHIWAAGKLHAFTKMDDEFCHFDGDVLLFKKPHVFGADVFAQSDEEFQILDIPESEEEITNIVLRDLYTKSGMERVPILPGHIRYSLGLRKHKPYNNGIFGGRDIDFIQRYAEQAMSVLLHPMNLEELKRIHGTLSSCFIEQYLLGSLARHEEKHIDVLFPYSAVRNDLYMRDIGYSHLLGSTKHDPGLMQQIYTRMENEHNYLFRIVKALGLPKRTPNVDCYGGSDYCSR